MHPHARWSWGALQQGSRRCREALSRGGPTGSAWWSPRRQVVSADTAGHCSWPGQVWLESRAQCIGAPTACPEGAIVVGRQCAPPLEPALATIRSLDGLRRDERESPSYGWEYRLTVSTAQACHVDLTEYGTFHTASRRGRGEEVLSTGRRLVGPPSVPREPPLPGARGCLGRSRVLYSHSQLSGSRHPRSARKFP